MSMTITNIAKNQMNSAMIKLSNMQRVNSAADDAAGLAIMEKMESQIKGLDKGTDNTLDMQNLVKTAEGGLAAIDDSLQRIRELSVQASSGIYTDSDRALIQQEVDQLIQGVNDMAKNTEYNKMKLLDGSFTNKQTASYPDGSGATISIGDMSSLALGLAGYTVTGSSVININGDPVNVPNATQSLNKIDDAISAVSSARSYLGAISNKFDYTVNSNSITMLNQAAAKSRIADLDVAKATSDLSKEKVINQYQIYNQKEQQERNKNLLSIIY